MWFPSSCQHVLNGFLARLTQYPCTPVFLHCFIVAVLYCPPHQPLCSQEAFKMLSNELLGFIRRQVGVRVVGGAVHDMQMQMDVFVSGGQAPSCAPQGLAMWLAPV